MNSNSRASSQSGSIFTRTLVFCSIVSLLVLSFQSLIYLSINDRQNSSSDFALFRLNSLSKSKVHRRQIEFQRVDTVNSNSTHQGLLLSEVGSEQLFEVEDDEILNHLLNSYSFEMIEVTNLEGRKEVIGDLSITREIIPSVDKFTYGNWCGPKYGGFDSNCVESCKEDLSKPSDSCIECRPPINYTDRVCMEHDFCQFRYETLAGHKDVGYICKQKMLNIGHFFNTRCECTYIVRQKLSKKSIVEECENLDCIVYGLIIEKAFNNILFDCGCYYKEFHRNVYTNKMYQQNVWKCVSPQECMNFSGK